MKRMPILQADETARKRFFENDGIVGTFSKKTEMAYAFGLIDAGTKKQIDLILYGRLETPALTAENHFLWKRKCFQMHVRLLLRTLCHF